MCASMTGRWRLAIGLSLLAGLASGCIFRGSRALDMSPFAENTSVMFAEASQVSRPFRAVYLKPYMHVPELAEIRRQGKPLIAGLRGLVFYSNQVVALNMSGKPDREKNALLADYLQEATKKVTTRDHLTTLGFSQTLLDSTLTEIRDAKTFLGGIAAASPLVNVVVLALLDGLDRVTDYLPVFIGAIDVEIEHEYREKRAAYEGLTNLEARYLIASTWLYEGESGNKAAVDSLLRVDPSMKAFIPSADQATRAQMKAAEEALVERLQHIDALIGYLGSSRTVYNATRQELEDMRLDTEHRIKVARDAVVVWGQSHRNLGLGVPVPPLINLSSIASKAAGTVPVP